MFAPNWSEHRQKALYFSAFIINFLQMGAAIPYQAQAFFKILYLHIL